MKNSFVFMKSCSFRPYRFLKPIRSAIKLEIMPKAFVEGEDYYINERGLYVFTERYLKERGYCCGNGCKHCPFEYINVKSN
jgi:hypothetical protein